MKICFIVPVQKPHKCGITDYVNLLSEKFEFENIEVTKFEIKDLNEIGNLEKNCLKQIFLAYNLHLMHLQKTEYLENQLKF